MIRIAFALLLLLHGFAHQVGFAASWQLGQFRTTQLDTTLLSRRIDVGVAGTRAMGVVWLLTGLAFAVAAVAVWGRWPGSAALTAGVATFSLALSILGWPDSRIGVAVNLAILTTLAVAGFFPQS